MKKFNLQEYLANPSQKIITRDGRKARILCTDMKNKQPVLALVTEGDREDIHFYYQNGVWCNEFPNHKLDLVFAPIKKEGWVNVFKQNCYGAYSGNIYDTKEEAVSYIVDHPTINYVTTTKIEWEE